MRIKTVPVCLLALVSTACASTPDLSVGYYLPRVELTIRAIRTVGCSTDNRLFSTTSVSVASGFLPDGELGMSNLRLRSLDGPVANADVAINYYSDGRLKGINATTVGRGQEVVSTVMGIAALALASDAAPSASTRQRETQVCQTIRAVAGDKPVTITYSHIETFDDFQTTRLLERDGTNPAYAAEVDRLLDGICAVFSAYAPPTPIVTPGGRGNSDVELAMRQPASVPLAVVRGSGGGCIGNRVGLWSGLVQVPQFGTRYTLPIPRAAMFGKQVFALAVSESGEITSLQYGRESGAPAMLSAIGATATGLAPQSTAARAADVEAEANLIAQQQRRIRCEATPATCE